MDGTIKIAITENESEIREQIASYLGNYSDRAKLKIQIDEYESGEAFVAAVANITYPIVFMDIYMDEEGMTGIDAVEKLRETDNECMVIFCTTSQEDMLKAFRCHAFDYILKPVTQDAVDRVMADAVQYLSNEGNYIDVKTTDGDASIMLGNILYTSFSGHYAVITATGNQEYRTRMKLSEVQELFRDYDNFLEINRGVIVNLDYVTNMDGAECKLSDGEVLPVRTKSVKAMRKVWQDYTFAKLREENSRR